MSPASASSVNLRLPRALLQYWDGPANVDLSGRTLGELFHELETRHPGLGARILDDQGRIRQHVAIFVNSEMLEERDPARVQLRGGDRVHVVPSVSGG